MKNNKVENLNSFKKCFLACFVIVFCFVISYVLLSFHMDSWNYFIWHPFAKLGLFFGASFVFVGFIFIGNALD